MSTRPTSPTGPGFLASAVGRDWLRLLGGVAFAVGAVTLFFRKSEEWGDFALLLVLLVPFALLYGLGLLGGEGGSLGRLLGAREREAEPGPSAAEEREADLLAGGPRGGRWRSGFLVLGLLLAPLVLFQMLEWVGGDTGSSLNSAWIFVLTAALAVLASIRAQVVYTALLGALAFLIAWLSFFDSVLDDPSLTTVRWLLVVLAAIFLAAALGLRARRAREGSELVTAAGIAAVLAGVISAAGLIAASELGFFLGDAFEGAPEPSRFWDAFLVAVSLLLVGYGARSGTRGAGYVGGLGLLAFAVIQGVTEDDFVGWPLWLMLAGGAAFAAGVLLERGGVAGGPPAPGAPPPGTPPPVTPPAV